MRANIRRVIDSRLVGEAAPAAPAQPEGDLVFADLRTDRAARMAFRGERRLELTKTEHTLLEFFMTNPGTVLARGVIFDHVWTTSGAMT